MAIFSLKYDTLYGNEFVVYSWFGPKTKQPSDEVVREQTLKYIREDFHENGHNYSDYDWFRTQTLLLQFEQ